jgi:hypothetical protein
MLVSMWSMPPPDALLGVNDQAEVCHDCGLGQLDPATAAAAAIPSIFTSIESLVGKSPEEQMEKLQEQQYDAALKAQKEQAAQQFAQATLDAKVAPSESRRTGEVVALWAVGGVAAIVALSFVYATIKKGGKK